MMISVALCLIGAAFLSRGQLDAGAMNTEIEDAQAFYVASSGIEYARSRLKDSNLWTDWTVNSFSTPSVDGESGTANITFAYNTAANDGVITATGTYKGQQKAIQVSVTYVNDTPFDHATCGCAGVNLNGAALVDSYNGAVLPYGDPGNPVTNSGGIGSNGDVDLGAATVLGSIIAGGNLTGNSSSSASGSARLGGNASGLSGTINGGITQNISPPPQPCDCDAIDVDAEVAQAAATNNNSSIDPAYLSGTSFSITSGTATLNAGTYYFTSLNVSGSGSVIINGEVLIFLSGSGPFKITGGGMVNDSNQTNNLRIYSNSTADIDLKGTTEYAGTIYAPRSTITLAGSTDVYGSLIGQVSIMDGSVGLHYDTSLPASGEPDDIETESVTVITKSWSQI